MSTRVGTTCEDPWVLSACFHDSLSKSPYVVNCMHRHYYVSTARYDYHSARGNKKHGDLNNFYHTLPCCIPPSLMGRCGLPDVAALGETV